MPVEHRTNGFFWPGVIYKRVNNPFYSIGFPSYLRINKLYRWSEVFIACREDIDSLLILVGEIGIKFV